MVDGIALGTWVAEHHVFQRNRLLEWRQCFVACFWL